MSAPVNTPSSMRPSMRVSRRPAARAGATLAVLALALSGCAGESGEGVDAVTGAPVNTESATSGSSSPVASDSAGSGDGDGTPSATASSKSPGSPDGEYVPASSEGPAQNVPVPEMPAAAQEQTQEGLEAALEYWWEADHYLKSTGDAGPIRSVSMGDCVVCSDLIDNWPAAYEDGVWAMVEPADVDISVANLESDNYGTLLFTAAERKSIVYAPDGSVMEDASTESSSASPWSASARFSDDQGHWQIEELVPQGQS